MSLLQVLIYAILGGLIIYLSISLTLHRRDRCIEVRDTMLAPEELERHAVEVARNHPVGRTSRNLQWLVRRMNENFSFISDVYRGLNADVKVMFPTAPASEWLLDNFYIIEEQVKIIRRNLSKGRYSRLPVLRRGYLKGYPRVYAIALEMIGHTDGRVDEKTLIGFINAYQTQSLLSMGEIWAVSLMLRIALVENIRNICENIYETRNEWHRAEALTESITGDLDEHRIASLIGEQINIGRLTPSFVEHLLQMLRKHGKGFYAVTYLLDAKLREDNLSTETVTGLEHQHQAAMQVSIGNTITSLRLVSDIDWAEIFESISHVENILRQDPCGVYPLMDFESRDYYRHEVEKLAWHCNTSELNIASKAVECAGAVSTEDRMRAKTGHVGYYLVGKGKRELLGRLGVQRGGRSRIYRALGLHPMALYLSLILFITLFLTCYFSYYGSTNASSGKFLFSLVVFVLALIPCSELAVIIVNTVLSHVFRPAILPKLEMKEGIPEDSATMVVIPTLLRNEKRAAELVGQLEIYYLANREKNIYFALVGDFSDAAAEETPDDEKITRSALEGIDGLNKRYSCDGPAIFYYMHRRRSFNPPEGKWMGWERKRGAIVELNRLLRGVPDTGFGILSAKPPELPRVRYVITLDADTNLPMGAAKRLVGTLAHPLNSAVIDRPGGIVTDGYGLLQPRISVSIPSANRSLFTRIFAGQGGIDPYTTAVSDIYQDVFGEGIYTGKGIYDIDVFREVMESRLPDNTILSHDLIEGCHLRAGLVTDIELVDGFPSRYNSYCARLHRWVRGDWQLVPWLAPRVRDRSGRKVENQLTALSRWKITDNLRRSLLNPSLFVLSLTGFFLLPGSYAVWVTLVLLAAASPLFTGILNSLLTGNIRFTANKSNSTVIVGIKAALYQSLLQVAYIPYQACLMADAVIRTLTRVFLTRRKMLEWVTAADVEASIKNDLASFIGRMWICIPSAMAILLLAVFYRIHSLILGIPLSLLWLAAPFAAYLTSKPYILKKELPSPEEYERLRRLARKTWRYFEDFAVKEDNYLPPDNYQEDPPSGIAHRTSPTNIGLLLGSVLSACDLGYTGVAEMAVRLDRIITTVEKMEKWRGHLYNWYNTITLDTLRPLYVSSVDSGNLVGCLMVLREGLREYRGKLLPRKENIFGLIDTIGLLNEEHEKTGLTVDPRPLRELVSGDRMDASLWYGILVSLSKWINSDGIGESLEKSAWGGRFAAMVEIFRAETAELFPAIAQMQFFEPGVIMEGFGQDMCCCGSLDGLAYRYEKAVQLLERRIAERTAGGLDAGAFSKARDLAASGLRTAKDCISRFEELDFRIGALVDATEFKPLFDQKRQLFSIGYNVEDGHLSKSYYDLLASEARQTSYIAVARGEVDRKHWFRLGRKLTSVDGFKGLISWTGTMFEYLMPLLIMRSYENTIFDETYSFVVRTQKKYARQRKMPWGISESGYSAFDINLNYQYKAFGVPELGFKRGLGNDMVVAPYASILAVGIDPAGVCSNLFELEQEGMDGGYGLYEAVDFTPSRLDRNSKYNIVKSYMAHHQGMSLLALNNFFNMDIMQQRFHADPVIKSAELLLQERSPVKSMLSKEYRDESVFMYKRAEQVDGDAVRNFGVPDTLLPAVHILSNGTYSVMVTDGGSGYSKSGETEVARWYGNRPSSNGGMYIYIQNINSNTCWSAAYEPVKYMPEKYRVVFSPDKAEYYRRDGNIETYTEVTVSPEDNAEVRRVSITNHSSHTRVLEVTSYFEAVLSPHREDAAHPAFSKLFVRTEYVREAGCLLASRRQRTKGGKPVWLVHAMAVDGTTVGDMQYETDRMKFIGRNRTLANPAAMEPDQPLSNSEGSVLDPVMSLRRRLEIKPGQTARVSFVAAVAETRKNALELAEKYDDIKASERVFELAWTRSRVESRYLGLKSDEVEFFLDLVPFLLFNNPLRRELSGIIDANVKAQPDLWRYGISGDVPIFLVEVSGREDTDTVQWALKGHEYWRMKGLTTDLLFLLVKSEGYLQPVHDMVRDAVAASHAREMLDRKGGVFIRNASAMDREDVNLLYTAAQLVVSDGVDALKGRLRKASKRISRAVEKLADDSGEPVYPDKGQTGMAEGCISAPGGHTAGSGTVVTCSMEKEEKLLYNNGLGGFSEDGREYVIHLGKERHTPAPWVNVVANREFGFLVTESGGGYTWAENSRENKLTPWSNDPVTDPQGEVFYIRDNRGCMLWSLTPMPIYEDEPYTVRHGFGYSEFEHTSHGIGQSLVMFAAADEPVKLCVVTLRNLTGTERDLSLAYYLRPVLGVDDSFTSNYLSTEFISGDSSNRNGILAMRNRFSAEFPGRVVFIYASEPVSSYTGDRREFTGVDGNLARPAALLSGRLSGTVGPGLDPCAVLQVGTVLKPGEEKNLVFLLGQTFSIQKAEAAASRYGNPAAAFSELERVRKFWTDTLGKIQVSTPDTSMDLLLNGWLPYQTISCRLWARSAYYQSGGAFGFRDQLQDAMSVVSIWPELTREQILLHASRQFMEGDVQHWWHAGEGKGIRTRYSDDLLWLPFVTADYIEHTGDFDILDERKTYLEGELLGEQEDERYESPAVSNQVSDLYEHCIRAIERSLETGPHGIPLMGSGDWNDGMNTVGNMGKGESVWLGWFLYIILKSFIPLCIRRNDRERADRYEEAIGRIIENMEKEAWDGSWYRRAYFDDGTPLGSVQNSECRIDSIAQSWSVISGAGRQARMEEAMGAVEKYLLDREEGIIKLLTPPFDEGILQPGYIKGYVPGVRENGGQYTHAASWVVYAFAKLGMGDRAWELFHMINPVNHTRTPIEYSRYKAEPYVIAADVYAVAPHKGRGGWTWYTGAAGWLYKVGLEQLLGINRRGGTLLIDPCIPADWRAFTAKYSFGSSTYVISVKNPDGLNKGVMRVATDGAVNPDRLVPLTDDGRAHRVDVLMGDGSKEDTRISPRAAQENHRGSRVNRPIIQGSR